MAVGAAQGVTCSAGQAWRAVSSVARFVGRVGQVLRGGVVSPIGDGQRVGQMGGQCIGRCPDRRPPNARLSVWRLSCRTLSSVCNVDVLDNPLLDGVHRKYPL